MIALQGGFVYKIDVRDYRNSRLWWRTVGACSGEVYSLIIYGCTEKYNLEQRQLLRYW